MSWDNEFTLVFTPSSPLKPGRRYLAVVDLPARQSPGDTGEVLSGAESGVLPGAASVSPFSFSFETQVPVVTVAFDPVRINGAGEVLITGTLSAEANNRNRYDWWRYRLDPCHPAFYEPYDDHNITVGRNVLVSDLGLLAKKSLEWDWLVAANNIKTTQPAADINVDVLNYQGRVLFQVKTDRNGLAAFPDPGAAAFIYARNELGRAYLRINDASSLAVSHFDVAV